MTGKELFREIGMIDEKYIVEAENTKRSIVHNVIFRRSLATAASLIVCIGLYFGVRDTQEIADMSTNKTANAVYQQAETYLQDTTSENVNDEMVAEEPYAASIEATITPENTTADASPMDGVSGGSERADSYTASNDKIIEESENEELHSVKENKLLSIKDDKLQNGQEVLDEFLECIDASKSASIEIAQLTEEGESINTCIEYNGTEFVVTVEASKDKIEADNKPEVDKSPLCSETYTYLSVIDVDGIRKLVLSDEKNLTADRLQSEEYRHYIVVEYSLN